MVIPPCSETDVNPPSAGTSARARARAAQAVAEPNGSLSQLPVNDAPYTKILYGDPVSGRCVRSRIVSEIGRAPFELCTPIRTFPAYRGRRSHQGRYWFSRSRSHVRFESRLEMTALRVLDFRGDVVQVSSNPFWLLWPKGSGPKRHAPDFFARRADGTVLVVDVKPESRITDNDRVQHALTREVCDKLGWDYEEFTRIDAVTDRNLRLLAGYRRPWFAFEAEAARAATNALQTAGGGLRLADLVDAVCADVGLDDATGLCGIYHMMWCGRLHVDLACPLAWDCVVRR